MKNINALKCISNIGTGRFIFLSVATFGIFPMMWGWKNAAAFNDELGTDSFDGKFFLLMAVLNGLMVYAGYLSDIDDMSSRLRGEGINLYKIIGSLMAIAYAIGWIYWSFKIKAALEVYAARKFRFMLKMNGVWTFLFQHIYINYCMNTLERAYAGAERC